MGGGLVVGKITRKAIRIEPRATVLIERAIHQLRRKNWVALAEYYFGTLPFVLGLLYFWSDMSGNPMAVWYCGPAAAGMAILFVWMKFWHVKYCRRLWWRLQDADPERWSWKRTFSTVSRQTALHATGVVILPLAAVILLPFGWVYAFYQNLCVLDDGQPKSMMKLARSAKEQAALWPGQNHIVLIVMKAFSLLVCLNLGFMIVFLPYLLKSILGIETVFTLSGTGMFNTTFLAVLAGLTYLCVDPILKTVYVLRCFHGRSQHTGDDLKSALRQFMRVGAVVIAVSFFLLPTVPGMAVSVSAGETAAGVSDQQKFADQLDDHIERVLEQRRFAWRLPRDEVPEPPEEQGWLGATFEWIGEKIKALFRVLDEWIEAFFEWLRKKIPSPEFSQPSESGDYRGVMRWIFYALGFGLAVLLIFWVVRWFKNSRPVRSEEVDDSSSMEIDLADESITAEDLPLDSWLALAQEMVEQQDFRRALRAMYLSILAQLADSQRVRIARYKSNRDYAIELSRRAHSEPELRSVFDWCVSIFERSWYGMHPVDRQRLDQFMDQQKRIADLVQPSA